MLMNDEIIFDHFYCINSAQTKEIIHVVHYILQPSHIFIQVKGFILMLVPGGLQLLISMCFARRLVTSINKWGVLIACWHVNFLINTWLFFFVNIHQLISCDKGFCVTQVFVQ